MPRREARSASVYNARIGSPESVVNNASRSPVMRLSSVAMPAIVRSGGHGHRVSGRACSRACRGSAKASANAITASARGDDGA